MQGARPKVLLALDDCTDKDLVPPDLFKPREWSSPKTIKCINREIKIYSIW